MARPTARAGGGAEPTDGRDAPRAGCTAARVTVSHDCRAESLLVLVDSEEESDEESRTENEKGKPHAWPMRGGPRSKSKNERVGPALVFERSKCDMLELCRAGRTARTMDIFYPTVYT